MAEVTETYADLVREAARSIQSQDKHYRSYLTAVSRIFVLASDLDNKARTEAWDKVTADIKASCEPGAWVAHKSTRSYLKRVCVKDAKGQYLKPWSVKDYTVTLRDAYDALADRPVRPRLTVEKILYAAGKKIEKLYPDHSALHYVEAETRHFFLQITRPGGF